MMINSRLYPHHDEGFFSYAVRLAEENGYQNHHSIYQTANLKVRRDFNMNVLLKDDLEKGGLLEALGPNVASMLCCMVQITREYKRIYNVEIYGRTIPNYLVNTSSVKLCADCMHANRYIKNAWQLLPITTCHKHKSMLIDQCPNCHAPFRWHSEVLDGCRNCGANWSVLRKRASMAPLADTFLSELFYHTLGLVPMPEIEKNADYAEGLFNLGFNKLASLLSLTAWVMPNDHVFWNMNYFEQKSNAETHQLLTNALKVYADWPNRFFTFLSELQGKIKYYSNRRGESTKDESPGLYRTAFGDYYTKLYVELTDNCFDFVRDAFEEFMVKHTKNAFINQYRKIDFTKLPKVYYTGQDVLGIYGMSPKTFKNYVRQGLFEGFETISNKKKVTLATRESVDMFMKKHNETLNSFDAAARIGINQERLLVQLQHAGLIKAVRGPEIDGHSHWRFDSESLDQLLDMFESRVLVKKVDPKLVVDFHKACKSIEGRYSPSYAELIAKVKQGSLRPCGVDMEQIGLCRYQFVKSDLYAAFKDELDSVKNGEYSLTEASEKLKMSRNRLSYLTKTGFLEHRLEPTGYIKVSEQSLEQFKKTYITLGEIQQLTGKSGVSLLPILKGSDFEPVNGEKCNENHQYLFARSDSLLIFINQLVRK